MNQRMNFKSDHDTIRVAAISLNTHALNLARHTQLILESAEVARLKGAELVLFPELSLSGYGCEDMFLSQDWLAEVRLALLNLIKTFPDGIIGCVGLPLSHQGTCYNVMAVISRDHLYGFSVKQILAKEGVHYEPRWFTPWPKGERERIDFYGFETELGSLVYRFKGRQFCFEICEDAWANERVGQQYADFRPSLVLNPSASHFAIGKYEKRQSLVEQGSEQFSTSYVYCNLLGCEAGRTIYDGGNLFSHKGKWLHIGERFSFEPYYMDLIACPYEKKDPLSKGHVGFVEIPPLAPIEPVVINATTIKCPFNVFEEVINAMMLALWDWQIKTQTKGFVISLSGGADSSLCAVAVFLAHQKAKRSFGQERYLSMLALTEKEELLTISSNLTTAYQKTQFSSNETSEAANTLAKELGSTHFNLEIDPLIAMYQSMITNALDCPDLNFKDNDLALQNIQARVRAPSVWLLANLKNQLLIATSNLSEASVGYCTMDGDTAGVLSPIAGLSKSFILSLNREIAFKGIRFSEEQVERHVIKSLQAVTKLNPSAELRPEIQSDEADLMPYEVLDFLRQTQQVKHMGKSALNKALKSYAFSKRYSDEQLDNFHERYLTLYVRNQWKRERLATGFHLEEDSCCPKTYRRYPVLSMLE
jgi:NAD+ synthase (glutamine-hydrolysing)